MSSCAKILRKVHAKAIEEDDLGKAKQFRLFSIARPHMRSFHTSWFCFFIAFTAWFGLQPLLPTIQKELHLSKIDLANSGTASISATIAVRVFIGPLCDRFGPRRVMSILLLTGSVPMALTGLIRNGLDLLIVRLFIGILGGTFVPCQLWTSAMFSPNIVGTANAIVGGWGNLGGGFTFILMPGLFQLVKVCGADEFLAWKIAVVIPSAICVIFGLIILFTSDDCPQGNWQKRKLPAIQENTNNIKKTAEEECVENRVWNVGFENDIHTEFKNGFNTKALYVDTYVQTDHKKDSCATEKMWAYLTVIILIIQYGMCFGIEIAVNTIMNLYLLYRFKVEGCTEGDVGNSSLLNAVNVSTFPSVVVTRYCSILDQDTASLITSLFGLMNLFARAMGGIYSDILRKHFNLSGRLLAHFTSLAGEGAMLIVFSQMTNIPAAIGIMIIFSIFVQMSEGTTFAIVPYIIPERVGVVAGLVGAGGNAGAMIWTTIWAELVETDPSRWFLLLGVIVLCGNCLTLFSLVKHERIWHVFRHCRLKTLKHQTDEQSTHL